MNIKNLIFPILVLFISTTACKKDNAAPIITATGELIDGGNPAADGTGFFVRLENNEELKPDWLPDSLQVAGTRVSVELTYQYTDKRIPHFVWHLPGNADHSHYQYPENLNGRLANGTLGG